MTPINLICFPFAGGNRYAYQAYQKVAPSWIKVIPLEPPGRGLRTRESLMHHIDPMLDDLYTQINGLLNEPYAIYGHSMGTLLGYLITHRILENKMPPPLRLFMTGCRAPSLNRDEKRHLLPKAEFIGKLREYGGTLDEILNNEDLMNYFEPVLRADFECIENYQHTPLAPLDIPITIMIGTEEPTTLEDAYVWQRETTQPLQVRQFPGKHFFIFDHAGSIMKLMTRDLQRSLVADRPPVSINR